MSSAGAFRRDQEFDGAYTAVVRRAAPLAHQTPSPRRACRAPLPRQLGQPHDPVAAPAVRPGLEYVTSTPWLGDGATVSGSARGRSPEDVPVETESARYPPTYSLPPSSPAPSIPTEISAIARSACVQPPEPTRSSAATARGLRTPSRTDTVWPILLVSVSEMSLTCGTHRPSTMSPRLQASQRRPSHAICRAGMSGPRNGSPRPSVNSTSDQRRRHAL